MPKIFLRPVKHLLLPAVAAADACILPCQSPPPGGVLRLRNSDDTLRQFVDARRHGGTHRHLRTHTGSTESHTSFLAASSEADGKVNDVIGAPVSFSAEPGSISML